MAIAMETIRPVDSLQLYNSRLLDLLEQKDEMIMELNRRIGRLEYEIELLQKEYKKRTGSVPDN